MALTRTTLLCLGLVAPGATTPLTAQVAEYTLSEPDAAFAEPFSLIMGLRELPDGRVMISDPLGQTLVIADLARGVADTLGNVGQGPGEYRGPDRLFPLPGDSTLLVDLGNARLTVVGPDGRFGETVPLARGQPGQGIGLTIVLPRGVDSRGRVYFQPFGGRPGGELPDSAPVVRWDRTTDGMDTVAYVKLPTLVRSASGGANSRAVGIRIQPLSPEDSWAVSWDGRVAAARTADYHLEWIEPEGRTIRGSPVPYKPVSIGRTEKEEWVEGSGGGLSVNVSVENGQRRMSFSRAGTSGRSPDTDNYAWPDKKPAFVADGVWVTHEGDAWVERSVRADEPSQFDVFGADANLKGRVTLPAGREIVGFGQGSVYLIRTDDDGLQWLERYRRS